MVAHPPVVSTTAALLIALLGLLTILLNYHVDYEKQMFRRAPDGKCELWGKPARFIVAQYKDSSGNVQASKLLLSGKCNLWDKPPQYRENYVPVCILNFLFGIPFGIYK